MVSVQSCSPPLSSPPSSVPTDIIMADEVDCTEVGPKAADPSVKSEGQDHGALAEEPSDPKSTYTQRIDKLIQEASPEILEAEVRSSLSFLSELKQPMMAVAAHRNDAMHWVKQIGRPSIYWSGQQF